MVKFAAVVVLIVWLVAVKVVSGHIGERVDEKTCEIRTDVVCGVTGP